MRVSGKRKKVEGWVRGGDLDKPEDLSSTVVNN
jgi:hypothetical protein